MLPHSPPCHAPRMRNRLRDAAIVLVALLLALAALPVGLAASEGGAARAVVFPPWVSAADAVARSFAAGHRVLRGGRFASVVIVAPDDAGLAPARPSGALLVMPLTGLAGCFDSLASARKPA